MYKNVMNYFRYYYLFAGPCVYHKKAKLLNQGPQHMFAPKKKYYIY